MAKQIAKLVEDILEMYPATRSSDAQLIIGVLQMKGANLTVEQRDVIRSVNFESIRRHRQALQADGRFVAVPEVAAMRQTKADEMRDSIRKQHASIAFGLSNKAVPSWMDGIGGVVV